MVELIFPKKKNNDGVFGQSEWHIWHTGMWKVSITILVAGLEKLDRKSFIKELYLLELLQKTKSINYTIAFLPIAHSITHNSGKDLTKRISLNFFL